MHFPLLQEILVMLGLSVLVVLLFQRLRLPSILGFLVTGIIIGPYGFSIVTAMHEVELLAEIGVILLLFVIGMELSLKQLAAIRKTVFIGGLVQVGLTVVVAALAFNLLGFAWNESVFIGFLFSLSSTAIVLKLLQDRNEISAPHGRIALGILIFQDIIVVPMMLVTPILAGQSANVWMDVLELLIKSVIVIVVMLVSARYIVPRLMHQVARTKSKELFILTTIAICFAVAFLTASAGLSLALGAFLAGLIISESEYSHQATSTILPFREVFTSFFFVSIGMLLDITFFMEHISIVLIAVLIIFLVKGLLASVAAAVLRYPPRTVMLTGLALFQVGEFAFILSKVGIDSGLLTAEMNQYFLSVSVLTMALTPFIFMLSGRITNLVIKSPLHDQLQRWERNSKIEGGKHVGRKWEDHLVIVGYGINGRNVARAAKYADIPYVIIELNAVTVQEEKAKGEDIVFGDPVHEHILHEVYVQQARVVVIAISDPQATKTIVSNIRGISQTVYLIVRTRFVREIDELVSLGADEVIPEEFETSIEIFSRVLHKYLVPMDQLENLVNSIRAANYEMLRPHHHLKKGTTPVNIPDLKIESIRVLADSGKVAGKTIAEANVRQRFGVNILAISRGKEMIHSVGPEEQIRQHDLVFVTGDQEQIAEFYNAVK